MVVVDIAIVVAAVLVWIGIWYAIFRYLRSRAEHIAATEQDVPRAVHRLQRLSLAATGGVFAVFVIGGSVIAAFNGHHRNHRAAHDPVAVRIAAVVLVVAALVVPLLFLSRAVRPVIARLRGVPTTLPDRRRRYTAAVIVALAYAVVFGIGNALVPAHGAAHTVGHALLFGVGLLVIALVVVPLVLVRVQTDPMPEPQRRRMQALAQRMGVRVREFRILRGRQQKTANAAQFGAIPGLRYVMITDYLVDHLSPDQLDAVVAHELGHARRHHIALKLSAALLTWVGLQALLTWVGPASGRGLAAVVYLPVVVAIPLSIIVVQGLVGVRLERQADDIAAREVGARPLAEALETLARLNHTQRRTGRGWSVLTQHPGIEERVDRLMGEGSEPPSEPPARTVGAGSATG